MKFKRIFSVAISIIFSLSISSTFADENITVSENKNILYPYMDTNLSNEERAADLVSRMTLEEKIDQLGHLTSEIKRLGVPKYNYWSEGLHGVARQGKATSFPTSLSLSNTWDKDLMYRVADITSTEARAKLDELGSEAKGLSYWSPTINMSRDPRWGRNDEIYGEDPFLTTQLAINFVNGMQGNDDKYIKTIATIKHFIANNCENERQGGTSIMDEQTLRDYYARAFQDVVEKSNPGSVMSSYNATTVTRDGKTLYEYIPSSANPYILNDLLRRNWGFDGYVVGDCGSVNNLNGRATYKRTLFPNVEDLSTIPQSATIGIAIKAGNDLDCGSVSQANAYEAVQNGDMSKDDVDIAVYRLMLQRMRTGEFDNNVPYQDIKANVIETDENVAVAEEAAEKSWVLLKNDNILPLKDDIKNIALVGALANEAYLGDYSGEPEKTVSPYQGLIDVIKSKNPDISINYLGNITDETVIMNLKSLKFILSDGKTREVDLSKAENIKGLEISEKEMKNITRTMSAVIKNVDFRSVVSVEAEVATGDDFPGGQIVIGYSNANQQGASIDIQPTGSLDEYQKFAAEYTGATGGYNQTADLYLGLTVNSAFSVEKYKQELDNSDIIIAYAGTTMSDAKESNDRSEITLPASQAHVDALTSAYPDKTIVAMQTVGQIDISSFENNSKAILWTCYNGQTQGTAFAKILTGDINPSGRLSTTWYNPNDLKIMDIKGETETDSEKIKWQKNNYSIRRKSNYPGRTYQYYSGKPVYPFGYGLSYTQFEYSNLNISTSNVDANEKFDVTVDVKNIGDTAGIETVQLYIKSPNGDGTKLPLKQLKGFERVELNAGELKTVKMTINVPDLHFYDEKTASIYIPTGEYIIMVGNNSDDLNFLKKSINITGNLNKKLKTVYAIPSGITLVGAVDASGNAAGAIKTINPNISAIMSDETNLKDIPDNDATIQYYSSNEDVAFVDENGIVQPNKKEGTAIITVAVTFDGIRQESSFPVVSKIKDAITNSQRTEYANKIEEVYSLYKQTDYSEKNWTKMTSIYNDAIKATQEEIDFDKLKETLNNAIVNMASIKLRPPEGAENYEFLNIVDGIYNDITVSLKYNGDEAEPNAILFATVLDKNGEVKRTTKTNVTDSGDYILEDTFNDGEKIKMVIYNETEKIVPLSKEYEHTYVAQELPSFVLYDFSQEEFNGFYANGDGAPFKTVRGLNGFGNFDFGTSKMKYTHTNGENYEFIKGLKGGSGNATNKCLYFTPFSGYSKCKITVLFNSNSERYLGVYQNESEITKQYGTSDGQGLAVLNCEITDMQNPVYIYGGPQNKTIYAIILEYE